MIFRCVKKWNPEFLADKYGDDILRYAAEELAKKPNPSRMRVISEAMRSHTGRILEDASISPAQRKAYEKVFKNVSITSFVDFL